MDANRKTELLMAVVANEIRRNIEPLNSTRFIRRLARYMCDPVFRQHKVTLREMVELYAEVAAFALDTQMFIRDKYRKK